MGRKRKQDRDDICIKISVSLPKKMVDKLKERGEVSKQIVEFLLKESEK